MLLAHSMLLGSQQRSQATIWNAADKDASITVTSFGITSQAQPSSSGGVRATTHKTTGKVGFRMTTGPSGVSQNRLGVCDSAQALNGNLSSIVNGVFWTANGDVHSNFVSIGTIATFGNSDVLDMLFDLTAKKFWGRLNGGNWNNSGTANPATGTGGLVYNNSGVAMFPCAGFVNADTDYVTLDCFPQIALPSGFNLWDQ
jgi:hypothetical protein